MNVPSLELVVDVSKVLFFAIYALYRSTAVVISWRCAMVLAHQQQWPRLVAETIVKTTLFAVDSINRVF